jgi:hypothetical protein
MPFILLLLLLPLIVIALMPFMLIQRYRVGSARRQARPWMAGFGLIMMIVSTIFFLVSSAITAFWVQDALAGAAAGVGVGLLLGIVGLLLTRWEATPRTLHYTPNRWLVLIVTFIVSARVLYGFYRSFLVAQAGVTGASVLMAFGIPESLAAGGTVIGYYLAYHAGLRWRIRRWQHRPLRPM